MGGVSIPSRSSLALAVLLVGGLGRLSKMAGVGGSLMGRVEVLESRCLVSFSSLRRISVDEFGELVKIYSSVPILVVLAQKEVERLIIESDIL